MVEPTEPADPDRPVVRFLHQRLDEVIARQGPEAVETALDNAHLFAGLRQHSRQSLRIARECWAADMPAQVVLGLDPQARKKGERVEIRTLTGSAGVEFAVRPRRGA